MEKKEVVKLNVKFNFPNIMLEEGNVGTRAFRALHMAGIKDTDTLIEKLPTLDITHLRNFGQTTKQAVINFLVNSQVDYLAKKYNLSREGAEILFLADVCNVN